LETLDDLAAAEEVDLYDGVVVDYVDPLTGGPTTTTIGCRMQMLRPGEETRSHRHTCSTVYHVVRGAGVTKIGKSKAEEDTLKWSVRDCFNIPPWYWHRFRNESSKEAAILFSASDRPLLDAIRLYREES
jgi:gentisate 1,2-dioxygenase